MRICYFALRPMQVGDEVRQPGDLVPEAIEWPFLDGYIREGKLSPVLVATLPKRYQDRLDQWEEEQRALRIVVLENAQTVDPDVPGPEEDAPPPDGDEDVPEDTPQEVET